MKHTSLIAAALLLSLTMSGFSFAQRPGRKGRPGRGPAAQDNPQADSVAKDADEKKILTAIEKMHEGPRYANVSSLDGRLLRMLAETTNAKRVVEIGTSTGESASWLALALRKNGGQIFTHEIDEGRAKVAAKNFKNAGVEKLITIVMGDAHETVKRYSDPNDALFLDTKKNEFIDILFLDADKSGYIDYLDKLVPLVRPGGLIIAHNMRFPNPDPDYLKRINESPEFETLFLLMDGAGVGVTMKKR